MTERDKVLEGLDASRRAAWRQFYALREDYKATVERLPRRWEDLLLFFGWTSDWDGRGDIDMGPRFYSTDGRAGSGALWNEATTQKTTWETTEADELVAAAEDLLHRTILIMAAVQGDFGDGLDMWGWLDEKAEFAAEAAQRLREVAWRMRPDIAPVQGDHEPANEGTEATPGDAHGIYLDCAHCGLPELHQGVGSGSWECQGCGTLRRRTSSSRPLGSPR